MRYATKNSNVLTILLYTVLFSTMSDISIFVTSELTSSERRISPQWDLSYFKIKLEQITGVEPKYQTILLYPNSTSNEYVVISDNNEYSEEKDRSVHISSIKGIVPYCRFHVKDGNPDSVLSQLEQEEQAQDGKSESAYEFKLSEDEYAKKNNTVLNWKKLNQLGRFDPQFNEIKQRNIEENLEISSSMKTGDMCRVINIQGERRGVVKFVGKIPELSKGEEDEIWVGVEFHEPVGKNDGTIDGRRIFECRPKHGSILKPKQVEVGDFPELDPFADSDDEL